MTPSLRFPEFQDAWLPKHGDDIFSSRRQRAIEGLPLYSVTMDQGMVRRDSLEREFASNAPDETNLRVFKDDHVYNMMRMWQGAVGRAPEDCMVSPAYVVLQPKPDTIPAFFDHWFKRKRSVYLLWAYSYGLTNDRLRLYARDFGRVPIATPTAGEQHKIAEFLDAVDERIKLLRRKRTALAQYKKGVLESLFNQSLRFKREDGTAFPVWEERQLCEVAKINPKSGRLPEKFEYIDLESVTNGQLAATVTIKSVNAPDRAQRVVKDKDILFQTVRPYQMNNLYFEHGENYVASTGYAQIRSHIDPQFLFQQLLTQKFVREVIRRCTGSSYPAINSSDLATVNVSVAHPDEQSKIASTLSALDSKISAVLVQIEKMQAFRKGLLQQMFV